MIVRHSGTELKLKSYLEVVLDCPSEGPPPAAEAARLDDLRADVTQATGL